jgi:hypothetical protein
VENRVCILKSNLNSGLGSKYFAEHFSRESAGAAKAGMSIKNMMLIIFRKLAMLGSYVNVLIIVQNIEINFLYFKPLL